MFSLEGDLNWFLTIHPHEPFFDCDAKKKELQKRKKDVRRQVLILLKQ